MNVGDFWLEYVLDAFVSEYLFFANATPNSNGRPIIDSIPNASPVILFAQFDNVEAFRLLAKVKICVGHELSIIHLITSISLDLIQIVLFVSISFSLGDFVQLIVFVLFMIQVRIFLSLLRD